MVSDLYCQLLYLGISYILLLVKFMYTVKENVMNEIVINKSRFIACIFNIKSVEEVKMILNDIREKYKDASHYCSAYIIDDVRKSSDDGEPGGTAGVPIMEVLNKNKLNYVLCIVVRYFGGIKLGAGGLVRAYSKSVVEVIKTSDLREIINGYKIQLTVDCEEESKLNKLLSDAKYNCIYQENIKYTIICDTLLKDKLDSIYDIESIKDAKIIK